MTTIETMHPRYSVGFQGDRATAANAALWAGQEALQEARVAWALVKEAYGTERGLRPYAEASLGESLARRLAVRLEQRAGKTLGLVSSSACGLWGLTSDGRVFQVDSTNGGSEYLTLVRFVKVVNRVSGAIGWGGADEWPISDVVAFFDSFRDLDEWRSR